MSLLSNVAQAINRVQRKAHRELRVATAHVSDREGVQLAKNLRQRDRLTLLPLGALLDLRDFARQMDQQSVPGVFIEAGCALGGSAIMLAASKVQNRPLFVHDVFGTIPPPSAKDGADVKTRYEVISAGKAQGVKGDTYYGYEVNLREKVSRSFDEFGYPCAANHVDLIEGLFGDTIRPAGPVALAHIDGDWYESVRVCLDRIWPHLSRGGIMVIDDYDAWSGCRTAVDEFMVAHPECEMRRRTRVHLVRSSAG